jgi:hypothetical protein
MQRPIFVAIGGDSGSGKSTLTAGFYRIFPRDQLTSVCLDDYHGLDRRERNLIGITALDPRANNFALMENQLLALKRGNPIMKPVYDHSDGTFGPPEEIQPRQVVIVQGLHPVGDLGPGREHEPLRMGIRAGTSGRDLDRFDASAGQDRVERCAELPGPAADQEPEVRGAVAKVHQEIPDLLHCPWSVRVGGHAEDVYVAGAGLHNEEAVQALEGHCAVHVKKSAAGIVEACACRNWRQVVPVCHFGAGGIFRPFRPRRIVDAPARWPSLSSSPWIRWYPQPWFSVARRSIRAVISAPTGGRPVRFG